MSTAAYSGPMPASLSTTFGSAPASMQQRRELVVGVDDRDDERGGAVGIDERSGPPCAATSTRPASSAFSPRRVHQRRPAAERQHRLAVRGGARTSSGAERSVHIGAALEQHAHGVGVILRRRPDQRGLAVPLLARVDLGAAIEQQLAAAPAGPCARRSSGSFRPRAARRSDRRRPRAAPARVVHAAVDRRQLQRRHAVAVGRAGVGAGAQQHAATSSDRRRAPPSAAPSCRRPRRRRRPPSAAAARARRRGRRS